MAVAKEGALARELVLFTQSLKARVRAYYGSAPTVLADFGWKAPKKPGPKSAAVKAKSAEKARATRKARGTMGKRQRQKIKAAET